MQKILFLLIAILASNTCLGQDYIRHDPKLIKSSELGISFMCFGPGFFDGELGEKTESKASMVFSPMNFGYQIDGIKSDLYFNLFDFQTTENSSVNNQDWESESRVRTLHWGLMAGYQFNRINNFRISPSIGLDVNHLSQPWSEDSIIRNQKGKVLANPCFNLRLEYRFNQKIEYFDTPNKTHYWDVRNMAVIFDSKFVYNAHERNLGIPGNLYQISIGLGYFLGSHSLREDTSYPIVR